MSSEFEHWHINATVYKDRVEEVHYISDPARNVRRQQCTKIWHIEKHLGRGGFGEVRLEKNQEDGQARAVKRIATTGTGLTNSDVVKELLALLEFSKPKSREAAVFVDFFGWFRDGSDVFLAMEYIQLGDLERNVAHLGTIPDGEARDIAEQILSGLEIMHAQSFAHRDLKPQNVLVVNGPPQWWVKIADFGLSKRLTDATAFHTRTGSLSYMAPEVLNYLPGGSANSDYTNAVDIWATGCIVYRIVCGVVPFPPGTSLMKYCEDKSLFPLEPLFDSGVKSEGFKFIRCLLVTNPKDRPSASEALKHKWITPESTASISAPTPINIPAVEVSNQSDADLSESGWNTTTHAGLKSVKSSTQLSHSSSPISHTASSSAPNLGRVASSASLSRKPVPQYDSESTIKAPTSTIIDNDITIKPVNILIGPNSPDSRYFPQNISPVGRQTMPFHPSAQSGEREHKQSKPQDTNLELLQDPFQDPFQEPAWAQNKSDTLSNISPSQSSRPADTKINTSNENQPHVMDVPDAGPAQNLKEIPSNLSSLGDVIKKSVTRVKAIFPYSSKEPDELSFREGEIIEVSGSSLDDDWWKGYIGNRQGLFPLNYVEHDMINGRMCPRQAKYTRVKAVREFSGVEPGSLSLRLGDICTVVEIRSDGFLKGLQAGPTGSREGVFPLSVVEDLPMPTPSDFYSGKVRQVKALFDFAAQKSGDLAFKEDDIIQILEPKEDDWWIGEIQGRRGFFPLNYIELLPNTNGIVKVLGFIGHRLDLLEVKNGGKMCIFQYNGLDVFSTREIFHPYLEWNEEFALAITGIEDVITCYVLCRYKGEKIFLGRAPLDFSTISHFKDLNTQQLIEFNDYEVILELSSQFPYQDRLKLSLSFKSDSLLTPERRRLPDILLSGTHAPNVEPNFTGATADIKPNNLSMTIVH